MTASGPPTGSVQWWGRWGRRTRSALVVAFCVGTATASIAYASAREAYAAGQPVTQTPSATYLAAWLVGICLSVLTIRRADMPEALIVLSSAAAILLPLDPTPALVGLLHLVQRAPRRRVALAGALVTAAVLVSVWRDSRGTRHDLSLWQMFGDRHAASLAPLPAWEVCLITTVVVGATLGLAVNRRLTRRAHHLEARDLDRSRRLEDLNEAVTRQSERERLAREIHDALGHRLSLISVHAGALEAATSDDDTLSRSAHLVQQSAQQSVEDLRSLLAMLRQPATPDTEVAIPSLRDLPTLIDEGIAAGSPVIATVFVDTAPMDEVLGHTAYRIVQELLTNARRHAPGVPIRLDVRAAPETGIEIATANALAHPQQSEIRPGNGLVGLSERVELVGGRSHTWLEGGAFHASVRLPWKERT